MTKFKDDWQHYEEIQNREDRQRDRKAHPDYLKRVKQDPSLEDVKTHCFDYTGINSKYLLSAGFLEQNFSPVFFKIIFYV